MEAVEIYRPGVFPIPCRSNATERIRMDVDAPYTTPKAEWQLIRGCDSHPAPSGACRF